MKDKESDPSLWIWSSESGIIDSNTLSMDELVEFLEEKRKYSSSGESLAIYKLIDFYKKHK